MKLLILTQTVDKDDPTLGFFHRWIELFAREFESVSVVCLREGTHDLPSNVEVRSLGKERGSSRMERVALFYRYALTLRYDAVFVHMNPEYMALGGLLWRIMGKKAILWYAHRMVDLKLRVATLFAREVFTPSRESFRLRSRKARIVGHGIDTDMFTPRLADELDPYRIVTVGRISPTKGYETMIEALSRTQGPLVLDIWGAPARQGDEAYRQKLIGLAADRGLSSRIAFKGPIANAALPSVLARAGAFVNASDTGSLDKAVLEAMACGIPAISSNEAFEAMLAPFGLAFESRDADGLSAAFNRVLSMGDGERQRIGAALRDVVVKGHSLPRLIGVIRSAYER